MSDLFVDAWEPAPKDGSVFKAKFADGTTSVVRWNEREEKNKSEWVVQLTQEKWVSMGFDRAGSEEPVVWWPVGHD